MTPPQRFDVGSHHVLVAPPAGWDVFNHGSQILMRNGEAQLSLTDLGPAGPRGIQRELERARELWREGKDKDARWRLRTIPVPDEAFENRAQRQAYWDAWHQVADAPEGASLGEVEVSFDSLTARTAGLAGDDFETVVRWGLAKIQDQRRDVGPRRTFSLDGREAVVLRTWGRSGHGDPRRVAMFSNDGYLLALAIDRGLSQLTEPAFDATLASLGFADSAAASPAPTGAER
jgi:hypothetical protein